MKFRFGVGFAIMLIALGLIFSYINLTAEQPAESPSPSFVLPYISKDEIVSVPRMWNPPNYIGIDFKGKNDTRFVAVCNGEITEVRKYLMSSGYGANITRAVTVNLQINSTTSIQYVFEPNTANESIADLQLQKIVVKTGDKIKTGDIIGKLYAYGSFPHLHLVVYKNGEPINPFPYFTEEAQKEIMELYSKETFVYGPFDTTPIDDIEKSLFPICSDTLNDFQAPVYGNYSPVDIDKIYMDVYNGRLYIKWVSNGAIPNKQETIGNNTIKSMSYNIVFDTDNNTNVGWCGAEDHLHFGVSYDNSGDIFLGAWGRIKVIDTAGEGTFQHEIKGVLHTGNGVIGKNYFIVSYNLTDFYGEIYVGKYVNLQFWAEAESNLHHHYAIDGFPNISTIGGSNWGVPWKVREIQI